MEETDPPLEQDAFTHRRIEAEEREIRHDVAGALTAVLASLEVAADAALEDSPAAREEVRTAISHARDAATRAVSGFVRMRR